MAIEFFTGFEGCASHADTTYMFDYCTGGYLNTSGFNGGKCTGGSGYLYDRNDQWGKSIVPKKTCAMGLHCAGIGTSEYLMYFIGPNIVLINTSSGVQIRRGGTGGTVLATVGSQISTSWNHVEAKLFSDATLGTLEIKVNGTSVCNLTGINTGGQDITQCRWCCSGEESARLDNFYIADDFQGELYSYLLKPNADVSTQFTPLSGTDNSAMLQSDDGDTSYVYSDTIGHKDLYNYEDLPENLIPLAVTTVTNARKVGTGERTIQSISKQDATEYDDSDVITLSTTYPNSTTNRATTKVRSLAPDGTAWTREKINAMQWGFKVTG